MARALPAAMNTSSLKSSTTECRKFAPNIFNKSKCQNCFRTKDAHSAEALESNRATRKVSTCGYLFVAPDWDFSQAVNRTRRWQRRWFVLYDDGELTYSVDEHPNTIPQAVIDMTKVVAVAHAEELTGNQFSIAITTPDKVHFVKGTGRDDSKWWFDVLSQFPSNMVRSKNKHNACNLTLAKSAPSVNILSCQNQYEDRGLGNRENYRNGTIDAQPTQQPLEIRSNGTTNLVSTNNREVHVPHNGVPLCRLDSGGSNSSSSVAAYTDADALAKSRSRRYLKRESRGLKSQRSRSDGVAKMVPASRASELLPAEWAGERDHPRSGSSGSPPPCPFLHNPVYLLLAEPHAKAAGGTKDTKTNVSMAQQLLLSRWQNETKSLPPSPNLLHQENRRSWRSDENSRRDGGDGGCAVPHSPPCRDVPQWNVVLPGTGSSQEKHASRGVPDGCGQGSGTLDATACDGGIGQLMGDSLPEDLFVKKGWLMRLGPDGEWSKHWFVLRNTSLTHFNDPSAEDSGDPSATLDLRMVREVKEVDLDRNYAFVITLWEADEVILCAVTAGIRTNWVQAIRQAVRNRSSMSILTKDTSAPGLVTVTSATTTAAQVVAPSSSPAPPNLPALEGRPPHETSSSDDHSEYFSIVDEDEEDVVEDPSRTLPPSPPLNRTAISRVKERARSRSNSRSRQSRRLRSPQPTQGGEPVGAGLSHEPDEMARSDRSSSWDPTVGMDVVDSKPPPDTSRSATPSKTDATTSTTVTPTDATPASARRPPVARTSRRSSSLRELRTKKLESRCSELEDQLRARDRELGQLRSTPHGAASFLLRGLPNDEVLTRSLESLGTFLTASVEKLSRLKEQLRKATEEGATGTESLRNIWGELETLISENSRRVEATTRALRHSATLEVEGKLARAAEEAWVLRRELKRSQDAFDDLELRCLALKRDAKSAEELHTSQLALMTARIDDLTAKLALSEKAQRQLRQRLARADSKQEKRRLSLKGKEAAAAAAAAAASPSKELEVKLTHLEHKLALLEEAFQGPVNEAASDASAPDDLSADTPTGRRSSLDSLSGDQQSLLLRVQLMDQRLQSALDQPNHLARPRICLQTEALDGGGAGDGWSSLSLATSVTDLRLPEHGGESPPASYRDCLDSLDARLDSLLEWLHEALISLREAGVMGSFPKHLIDRIGTRDTTTEESNKDRLVRNLVLLQHIGSKLTTAAGFDAHFFGNLTTHLRETSLVLFAFEERLDQVACSHDLRLVTSGNNKSWDPLVEATGHCQLTELESPRGTEGVVAEVEELSSRLKSLGSAAERFSKSRQVLVVQRLSECLDIHPTSDLEPDALQNVAEQEAVLGAVMEALSVARAHVSDSLCQSLCSTSGTISTSSADAASLLRQLEGAMRQEFLKVRRELRASCLAELESYCSANLPRDLLNRELVPVVRDLATANCISAVLRAYVSHVEEVVRQCTRALRQDEQAAASPSADDAVTEKTVQELCNRAAAVAEGAPSLLRSWLTQCLAEEELHGHELGAGVACVNSTTDVTDALERLSVRLREEREGHRQRVLALQDRLDATQRDCERLLKAGCATCRGLREQTKALAQRATELERAARDGTLCERCPAQQEQLRHLAKEHSRELAEHEASAREEFQGRFRCQEANHQREVQRLEAELQAAKNQLQRLQEEQEERIGSLRELYQQKLSQGLELVDAEAVRQRCRPEMEQLKHLCEKGLAALEASHGHLVAQLQERHQAEIERLRAERDRALAEETKATLAALNAMQRAHQEELHREISNFKEDYAQQMRHGRDTECLQREHQEEREHIKQEILSLSEKYSLKCLEKASLEERLQRAGLQLQEANYQVLDLLARNKQLASHLGLQILQREQAVPSDNSPEALEKLLQLRDSQLVQQREENAQILHSLQLAKTKINQLNSQCQQLSSSLRAERSAHQAEAQRLQARLEGMVAPSDEGVASQSMSQQCRPVPERRSSLVIRKQAQAPMAKGDSHKSFSRPEATTSTHSS